MSSPTQRSREWFKKMGIASAIVERWNPHAHIRQDVFGFIDLIALIPATGIDPGHVLAVQIGADCDVSKKIKKITEGCPHARDWLESGGRIVVHGWGKKGGKGKRKLWELRAVPVTLADLPPLPEASASTGADPD